MQGAPYLTPPYQNLTTSAVLLILNSTRANDIPNVIKGLDQEQQAHLMAYLYKVGGVGTLSARESARERELTARATEHVGSRQRR